MLDRPGNINLYLLYAREDEELKNALERHLSALHRQGYIDVWHDGMISAGADVTAIQREYLAKAHVILLLISSNFLAPDCYNRYEEELKKAYARQKAGEVKIIPVILRDCLWQFDLLASLKPLPTGGHPIRSKHWDSQDTALKLVAQELQGVARELMSTREKIEQKVNEAATKVLDYSIDKLQRARTHLQAKQERAEAETPAEAGEETPAEAQAVALMTQVLDALVEQPPQSSAERLAELLHPSLLQQGRLEPNFRKHNFEVARERIHLYCRPPEVEEAKPTGRNSLGFLASRQAGEEWRYVLARRQAIGGLPGYLRIFYPEDGSPPRLSGLSL